MLHHLQGGTKNRTAEIGLLGPETTLEAIGPAGEPASGWDHFALILIIGNDLGNLDLDIFGFCGLATETRQGLHCLFNSASLDKVARRVRKEEQTNAENEAPGELDTDRNAVGASVASIFRGIIDAGGEEYTDGNAELVAGNKSTTDLSGTLESAG